MAVDRLIFHLTDRCQLNCDHCLRDPGKAAVDLEVSLIESVLDQARALYGTRHVALTGGEPTLHPRFYEILDAIAARDYSWHMVSNGARFDRVAQRLAERPERLAALTVVNFSLDGATPETHNSIREQGSFREVMQAVSVCRARGIEFLLQITLNARNVGELEEMALLASQLGASRLSYSFAQPSGTFLDDSLYLPASEWRRVMDRIERVMQTFKLLITHTENGPHPEPFFMCDMWKHTSLHIDHTGQLSLCCQHAGVPGEGPIPQVAGDLREVTLAQAHANFAEIIHQTVRARLQALQSEQLDEWDRHFSCNWCLKQFGKPHWVEGGAAGVAASRVRWRGKWSPGYKPSHVQHDPSLAPGAVATRERE